jgi:hypothetical protein
MLETEYNKISIEINEYKNEGNSMSALELLKKKVLELNEEKMSLIALINKNKSEILELNLKSTTNEISV